MHHSENRHILTFWTALAVLLAILMILLPEAAGAQQYRQTGVEFLRELSSRLDAAQTKAVALDARNSANESAAIQTRPTRAPLENAPVAVAGTALSAEPDPQEIDGAYTRVSERMRHKSRVVNSEPDELGRVKAKMPMLREQIAEVRNRIQQQELAILSSRGQQHPRSEELAESERHVAEIEKQLSDLETQSEIGTKRRPTRNIKR